MLTKNQIDTMAAQLEVHPSDVQKDYVFGWILFGIFTASDLREITFLKGGNALRKGYFANTRFSKDLDFGIPDDIAPEMLLSEINKVCAFIQAKTRVIFVNDKNRVEEKFTATESPLPDLKVYEVRVYFKDFYGKSDYINLRISMDITRFDKVLLDLQSVALIHPYPDAEELKCTIRCMKLEEIIATKLKCLIQRQHAPDLFDYAHTIKLLGGQLNKQEVITTLIKKTIFDRNPYILKDILLNTAFAYFREEWDRSVICAREFVIAADDAIGLFVGDLDDLFNGYTDNGFTEFIYFDAKTRAKIMHAGRTQTLLRVRYKNYDRIVEPYSLKYLEKKSGDAREYFFVYNCTGGENEPGIRMFVPERVESLENTDDRFIPRAQIELSKAGELPENRYLFDPNRPIKSPRSTLTRTRRQTTGSSLKYKFKCSVCGRKFSRSSHDSSLRAHKGKNGYQCYGTYGVYLGTSY